MFQKGIGSIKFVNTLHKPIGITSEFHDITSDRDRHLCANASTPQKEL